MPPPAVPSKPVIPPDAIKREPLSASTGEDARKEGGANVDHKVNLMFFMKLLLLAHSVETS